MAKLMHMPYTEFGARLVVDDEVEQKCKVVYKPDGEGGAVFHSVYDETAQYPDDYIILSFRSVLDGESDEYKENTNFANVKGSTEDHKPCGFNSWIELMRYAHLEHCDLSSCCAKKDTIYAGDTADEKITGFECKGVLAGGHVIIGAKNSGTVDKGERVLLLPICNNHNTYHIKGSKSAGTGYYMKTCRKTSGLLLKNYLKISQLEEYNGTIKDDAAV